MYKLKIIISVFTIFYLNCLVAQQYNSIDSLYIKCGNYKKIKQIKYIELIISTDSNEIAGYIRYDGTSIFFLSLDNTKEKILLLSINKNTLNFDVLENFGDFRTIQLVRDKNMNSCIFNVNTLGPKISHIQRLNQIKILNKSADEISLLFLYSSPYGEHMEARLYLKNVTN